jgi:hypothetical protein
MWHSYLQGLTRRDVDARRADAESLSAKEKYHVWIVGRSH